jgi:hypothetical protein
MEAFFCPSAHRLGRLRRAFKEPAPALSWAKMQPWQPQLLATTSSSYTARARAQPPPPSRYDRAPGSNGPSSPLQRRGRIFCGPNAPPCLLALRPRRRPALSSRSKQLPKKKAGDCLLEGGGADSALVSQGPAAQGSICKACPAAANQGDMSQTVLFIQITCLD